jgi:type IV secretory pathway VirJ component
MNKDGYPVFVSGDYGFNTIDRDDSSKQLSKQQVVYDG